MLFIDDCPAWEEQVGSNDSSVEEYSRLVEGPAWEEMLERVSGPVGRLVDRVTAQVRTRTGVELGRSEVALAWDMCRTERAWRPTEDSPWCSFFSPLDLQLFNFRCEQLNFSPSYPSHTART